jgi:hypothetical protein
MPVVDGKRYPYTAEGKAAAERAKKRKNAVAYGKRGVPGSKTSMDSPKRKNMPSKGGPAKRRNMPSKGGSAQRAPMPARRPRPRRPGM